MVVLLCIVVTVACILAAFHFKGWMMLAELYAIHFKDLLVADQTVHELCQQPNVTPSEIAVALHRLADWHLKLGEDPVSAREVLDEICRRFPHTHLERMARARRQQLPATRQELREQREGKPVRLPALKDELNESGGAQPMSEQEAVAQANGCVEKLKQDPDNVPAREALARLFAEQLGQWKLSLEQMELLLEMPGQPDRKMAEWLSLMAAWQMKYGQDRQRARSLLERLIRDHPQSVEAFAAQRRLNLMDVELRLRQAKSDARSVNMASEAGP